MAYPNIEDLSGTSQSREGQDSPGTPTSKMETQQDVSVEIGNTANPPRFDKHLIDLLPDAKTQFVIQYPEDHSIAELAGTSVDYTVKVKNIKRRVLPDLDDEFAKSIGQGYDTLADLTKQLKDDIFAREKRFQTILLMPRKLQPAYQ